jgi:hypothetical protein
MASLVKGELAPQELAPQELDMGLSIINMNPIDVVEKLGKYQFIYDYNAVPAPIFYNVAQNLNVDQNMFNASIKSIQKPVLVKEGGSNANMIAPIWAGLPQNLGQYLPQPVSVNANPQVGVFSKGDIVNVIRFEGSNAIIENPNYVALETTNVKPSWISLLSQNVINKSEFMIPKEYLMKVKDNFLVTIQTGINFGANLKPQPIYNIPPIKTIPFNPVNQTILEENASFVLAKDFQYISGYGSRVCAYDMVCPEDVVAKYSTLKAGTKVTGRLFREMDNIAYKLQAGAITPPPYKDYLAVKGYGSQGSINIPIEYLTKDIPTNSGIVVPVSNDNNNLLLIAGAVILGYALFSNDKSE